MINFSFAGLRPALPPYGAVPLVSSKWVPNVCPQWCWITRTVHLAPRCCIYLSPQSIQTCNVFLGRHTCTHAHTTSWECRPRLPCHKVWVKVSRKATSSHPCLLITCHFAIRACEAQAKVWSKPQTVPPCRQVR